jgi:hypothetical protein
LYIGWVIIFIYLLKGLTDIVTTFQELWGPDYSPVFAATMSYNRFVFLLSHLRLDNAAVREEARRHDKFAAARYLYEFFKNRTLYFTLYFKLSFGHCNSLEYS